MTSSTKSLGNFESLMWAYEFEMKSREIGKEGKKENCGRVNSLRASEQTQPQGQIGSMVAIRRG